MQPGPNVLLKTAIKPTFSIRRAAPRVDQQRMQHNAAGMHMPSAGQSWLCMHSTHAVHNSWPFGKGGGEPEPRHMALTGSTKQRRSCDRRHRAAARPSLTGHHAPPICIWRRSRPLTVNGWADPRTTGMLGSMTPGPALNPKRRGAPNRV